MSQYWIVAVPAENKDAQATRKRLDDATSGRGIASSYKFRIPKLKVGTIDTLIALSDELGKLDGTLSTLTKKIKRTFDDTRKNEPTKLGAADRQLLADHHGDNNNSSVSTSVPDKLLISDAMSNDPHSEGNGKTPHEALQKYKWNRYVYNENEAIDKIRLSIMDQFSKSEEELRRLLSEYNEMKVFVSTHERKMNGTLLVRPISKFVQAADIINTKHLTTVVLAIPRTKEVEFLQSYEKAESVYVAKQLAEKKRLEEMEAKEAKMRESNERKLGGVTITTGAISVKRVSSKKDSDEFHDDDDHEIPHDDHSDNEYDDELPKSTDTTKGPATAASSTTGNAAVAKTSKLESMTVSTVVPGSAKKIVSEKDVPGDEFVLYRVVLFKRPDETGHTSSFEDDDNHRSTANVERFKTICRDNRWTLRQFKFDAEEEDRNKLYLAELLNKRRARWEHIVLWCESQFEEVFSAWVHVLAMRTYVEAILRYGLSTEWVACLLCPNKGQEKKLRDVLFNLYKGLSNQALLANDDEVSALAGGEYYPYVYIPVDFADL